MTYYMRDKDDVPHLRDEKRPGQMLCGLPVLGMRKITHLQVLVWLRGRTCTRCTPLLARSGPTYRPGGPAPLRPVEFPTAVDPALRGTTDHSPQRRAAPVETLHLPILGGGS
jgi:hypothetical protein